MHVGLPVIHTGVVVFGNVVVPETAGLELPVLDELEALDSEDDREQEYICDKYDSFRV